MADINSDSDPDSAAMAEAMGFTGFGMQNKSARKRKLTPPAQTGANSAPLGKRRLLDLPQPVAGLGNDEEIDLDNGDDGGGGGEAEGGNDDEPQAGLGALSFTDAGSSHLHQRQQHHQLPPKPQQQHRQRAAKAARQPRGGGPSPGGRQATPWWEGTWDLRLVERMVENPWERLEKQRGLEAWGIWPARRGGGAGAAGAAAGGTAGADVGIAAAGGGAVDSPTAGGVEETGAEVAVQ